MIVPLFLFLVLTILNPVPLQGNSYASRRDKMIEQQIQKRGIQNPRVLEAMRDVNRHLFIPPEMKPQAYEDRPLPIHFDQTISQPYIVALMTELLDPQPNDIILEVGTGSGYQAAVLAKIVRHVYSIEIIEGLAKEAAERLKRLKYNNVIVRAGDGYQGWPEQAPFDGIIVTAAAPHIPPPLIQQLKPGGKMIIPVGATSAVQELLLIEKKKDGTITQKSVLPVRFVPLTRKEK